jgi:type IV pilus secretin PilQ/predicted competence protein
MGIFVRSSRPFHANVRHARSLVIASIFGAAFVASVTANGGAENGPAVRAELTAIASKLDARVSTILIESSESVAYVTSQPDPLTLVIDLRNVAAGVLAEPVGPVPPVVGVDVEETTAPDGASVARVRVKMGRPATHNVHSARNVIYVDVERPAGLKAEAATSPKARPAAADTESKSVVSRGFDPAPPPAKSLRGVRALPSGTGVAIRGDGQLVAASVQESKQGPARAWLDFANVSSRGVPAETEVNEGEIQRIRVATNSAKPLLTRVVVDLVKQITYRVEQAGDELRVLFDSALGNAGEPAPPAVPADIVPEPAAPPSAPDAPIPGNSPAAAALLAANAQPQQSNGTMLDGQQITGSQAESQQPRFRGTPVSLDFQGADLRAVLRTFAEISGLNIVIDPTINGTVDVSLRDVPWDQALDIILRANKLGYRVDGTVVRIAPLNVLAQEQEEQRKLTEAQALAGDLRVLTVPLSYAKAPDLVPILTRSALSARGEVQVDSRTNTLIVRDLADRLGTAAELVKALDRPQPQVEIEARIVASNREFARAVGVQWGLNGRLDPALGNTTPLAFPNSGSLTGRTGGLQGPVQGDTRADTGINLGVPAATSAMGIALGSINGALNLDVALSAMESSGRGRVLSSPRVATQNNVEAEMTQGTEIPIQTVANNTVTVSFKPAALTLRVTPQITASNTIIMRVFLENASPDFSRQVNGIPPIDTQRAQATVLVGDGETTVIGGVYLSREQATEGRVPMLHRIPLLGWLFKRDTLTDVSNELLIFITPRITRS